MVVLTEPLFTPRPEVQLKNQRSFTSGEARRTSPQRESPPAAQAKAPATPTSTSAAPIDPVSDMIERIFHLAQQKVLVVTVLI